MRRIALSTLFVMFTVLLAVAQGPLLKLRQGDRLGVTVFGVQGYDGEYVVLSDGNIYGRGFGQLQVTGKSVPEVERDIKNKLKGILKNPTVSVVILSQQQQVVFLSGLKVQGGGAVPWMEGMELRQLLALAELPADLDMYQVRLFRPSEPALTLLLSGAFQSGSHMTLKPNDVVVVLPTDYLRVWVTGSVVRPGLVKVPNGTDVQKALAEAGGLLPDVQASADYEVQLKRGTSSFKFRATDLTKGTVILEPGDVISVVPAERRKVTVTGLVRNPGRYELGSHGTILEALALSGDLLPEAKKNEVIISRRGDLVKVDMSTPATAGQMVIEDGDVVIVTKNELSLIAIGALNKPGIIPLEEGKQVRLSDVLALGNGLTANGSMVHVFLGRMSTTGKMVVNEFDLNAYFKKGDQGQNPLVHSGDIVLVGDKKGPSLLEVVPVLNSAVLLYNVLRR